MKHRHKCADCGRRFTCWYKTLEQCRQSGVLKAAQVNGQGPFCAHCQIKRMTAAVRQVRRWNRELKRKL